MPGLRLSRSSGLTTSRCGAVSIFRIWASRIAGANFSLNGMSIRNCEKAPRSKVLAGIPAITRGGAPGASRTVPVWQTAQFRNTRSMPWTLRRDIPTGRSYRGSAPGS